jgi:hypothetical protein
LPSEADTCRKYVVPKLQAAGWDIEPCSIAEQRTITDGRIVPVGKGFIRKPPRRADYLHHLHGERGASKPDLAGRFKLSVRQVDRILASPQPPLPSGDES